jgi:hypothetical protein
MELVPTGQLSLMDPSPFRYLYTKVTTALLTFDVFTPPT